MIRLFTGACGTGKTFALKTIAAAQLRRRVHWAHLVLDLNNEWPGPPGRGLLPTYVKTVAGARKALADGRDFVIVRPALEAGDHQRPAPWATLANELADVAIKGPPTILILPEAHTAILEGYPVPPHLATILHRFRHPDVRAGLWVDTQHLRDLAKPVLNEAQRLYLFSTGAPGSIDRAKKLGGPELVAALQEAGRRHDSGSVGWHVQVSPINPRPPFELVRV